MHASSPGFCLFFFLLLLPHLSGYGKPSRDPPFPAKPSPATSSFLAKPNRKTPKNSNPTSKIDSNASKINYNAIKLVSNALKLKHKGEV
jgi:hypothetical protein